MNKKTQKVRCINTYCDDSEILYDYNKYYPLILNEIYLTEEITYTVSDVDAIMRRNAYFVFDLDKKIYYGIYPQDYFITLDEWRESQINQIFNGE
jgi:hypothetical protein